MDPSTTARLDAATAHLDAAADLAGRGPAPRAAAIAALIHLLRAGISPGLPHDDHPRDTTESVHDHLQAALAHLDKVDALDGPPDLPAWAWHVEELIHLLDADPGRGRP